MDKNIKELISYIISFLVLWQGIWIVIILAVGFAFSLYPQNDEPNDHGLLVFFMTGIFILSYLILRFIILVTASIIIIKKSRNPLLLTIYNNIKTLSIIIISLLGLDILIFLISGFILQEWELITYFMFYSGISAFLPIVLVALVNIYLTIKFKML